MTAAARGRFVSLEGGEGGGKSTQVRALAAALRARGLAVAETREPGGSPGAEAIRRLLLAGGADRWEPRAEALLFAAARAAGALAARAGAAPEVEALARGAARDGGGGDRFGARDRQFHAEVGAAFRRLAAAEPGRFRTVDATGAAQAVTDRLLAALADLP